MCDMARKGESDERFERLLRALGYAVLKLQKRNGTPDAQGVRLTEIRFKLDADNRTSVLVILKGDGGDGPVVGFAGGPDMETAVLSAAAKIEGGGVRWREDRPWPGPA